MQEGKSDAVPPDTTAFEPATRPDRPRLSLGKKERFSPEIRDKGSPVLQESSIPTWRKL